MSGERSIGGGGRYRVYQVIALVLGALFVRRQRSLPDPMIDLSLFRIRAFNSALVVNFLTIFVAARASSGGRTPSRRRRTTCCSWRTRSTCANSRWLATR